MRETKTHSSASTCVPSRPHRARATTTVRAALALTALSACLLAASPRLALTQSRDDVGAVMDRAIADFLAGRLADSVRGFDRVATLAPESAPELWQRGIALYYVGRYRDCRLQFESHRTVNPADVENPAWHFLCVARAESPARARQALLPVGGDPRRPMREIYEMFKGAMRPEAVLTAAGNDPSGRFFAELYVGLYFDAAGDTAKATEHLARAADRRYAGVGGYMHTVATLHPLLHRSR